MEKVSRKKFVIGMLSLLKKYPRQQVMPLLAKEVIARGWSGDLETLMAEVAREYLESDGELEVRLQSARELKPHTKDKLESLLKKKSEAKEVRIQEEIMPELLGGVVADSPAGRLDVSVAKMLNQLRQNNG